MLRPIVHILLHALVPAIAARIGWSKRWMWAWTVMLLTNLIDMDHLLADPIYDGNRCSIDFHPLHSYPAMGTAALLLAWTKTRVIGLGLAIHYLLDVLDCWWMLQ